MTKSDPAPLFDLSCPFCGAGKAVPSPEVVRPMEVWRNTTTGNVLVHLPLHAKKTNQPYWLEVTPSFAVWFVRLLLRNMTPEMVSEALAMEL